MLKKSSFCFNYRISSRANFHFQKLRENVATFDTVDLDGGVARKLNHVIMMWQSTVAPLHPSVFLPDVNSEMEEALAGGVVGDPSTACRNL